MQKLNKIIIAAFIILLLIASCFVACDNKKAEDNTDKNAATSGTDSTGENTGEEENGQISLSDDLPDMDFGGYNFRVYIENQESIEAVCAETDTGDVVNDAVYKANRTVEDRFNIKITPLLYGSLSKVKTSIMAADDSFDIVTGHDISMGSMSLENVFMNLYKVPHLNFSKPWWPQNTVESLTLMKDKMYIFSNHISFWWIDNTRVMFFNKNRLADLGYPMPYQDVFDGKWTFDKFLEMAKDTYIDQNGNGEKDEGDFFGFVKSDGEAYCYLESWGIQVTVKDKDDILKVNDRLPEIMPGVLDKLYELLFTSPGGYQTKSDYALPNNIFAAGNSLFLFKELSNARQSFKDVTFDYGILPMPKIEGQKDYVAGCTDRPYAIPNNAPDIDRTGIIVEAMSAEGYKQVLPAYYEIALKVKYTHDDESVRVLDIITQSSVLDFWYIYGGNDNNMIWCLPTLLKNSKPTTDFASYYEKTEGKQQKRIEQVISAIESMD